MYVICTCTHGDMLFISPYVSVIASLHTRKSASSACSLRKRLVYIGWHDVNVDRCCSGAMMNESHALQCVRRRRACLSVCLCSNCCARLICPPSSLPQRLCTRLPSLRSAARLAPQRTSATALFDYISAGRSTHCACHHWRPNLPGGCCICLERSAGVSIRHRRHCKFFAAD